MNQLFTSTSRVLAALLFVAVTTESAAQSFTLPYNPDENGDMLIGVVDLQALLANYGLEFSSAVLSEDGESAITYMGDMAYPLCALSCENLPGMWHMATMTELAMVWEEVYTTNEYTNTWVGNHEKRVFDSNDEFAYFYSDYSNSPSNHYLNLDARPGHPYRCYCAARQLPRVEFYTCGEETQGPFDDCCNALVQDGWYPVPGSNPGNGCAYPFTQSFWRWAE